MRDSSSRSRPVLASRDSTRASPVSTTAVTPGIVSDVSATFVARMMRRLGPGFSAASCFSGGRSPYNSTSSAFCEAAKPASASAVRRISPTPGKKQSTSPAVSCQIRGTPQATSCAVAAAVLGNGVTRRSAPISSPTSIGVRYRTSTGYDRPVLSSVAAPPSQATSGAGSSVADMTTSRRSGRTLSRTRRHIASARSLASERS